MPSSDDPNSRPDSGPLSLTFILPTRNRREWVFRALESCLQAHQPGVAVEVLVVDGQSTDGSFEEIQRRYAGDARVRALRQEGAKGFMAACFFGVARVRTPYVTFMYDDDVLSPFWVDVPRAMQRHGAGFGMGFSAESDVAKTCDFRRVAQALVVPPSLLLQAFCGRGHELSAFGLPFNPICCLTRTEQLRGWMEALQEFTRGHPLREHFMMQRNAGPDLMIYFHSILGETGDIPVLDGPVAQFSAHAGSITSGFEPSDLTIGYWLAQVWLCDRLRAGRQDADAGWCGAYTVKQGLRLALRRLRRRQSPWLGALLLETFALAGRSLMSRCAGAFMKSLGTQLLPRRWRPRFGLSTRTEPLLA